MRTPRPRDESFFIFAFKICLPHRSVTSFLRGAPPPKKNPGSAPEMELENSVEEDSTTSSASKKRKRPPRLSMFEVSEIAVSKGIQAYTDLLALAPRQKREGKIDLAEFIVN